MAEETENTENNELEQIEQETKTDEETQEQIEQKTEEKQEEQLNDSDEQEKAKQGTIDKIREKLGLAEKKSDSTKGADKAVDIPDDFTNAAKEAGWEDSEIVEFAEGYKDKDLLDMIPFLEDSEQAKDESGEAEKEPPPKNDKGDIDKEKIKEELKKELLGELGGLKESLSAAKQAKNFEQANELFDKLGKEFPVFGKTEELPRFPAGKNKGQFIPTDKSVAAREEVYSYAVKFSKLGASWKDALDDAVALYKGRNLKQDVKRNLIKGLKRNEKNLSSKRTTKSKDADYATEDDRRTGVVKELARKAGVTGME